MPNSAFFLLPTRAWELTAGGLLWFVPAADKWKPWLLNALSVVGAGAIVGSACLYGSATTFPGATAHASLRRGSATDLFQHTTTYPELGRDACCTTDDRHRPHFVFTISMALANLRIFTCTLRGSFNWGTSPGASCQFRVRLLLLAMDRTAVPQTGILSFHPQTADCERCSASCHSALRRSHSSKRRHSCPRRSGGPSVPQLCKEHGIYSCDELRAAARGKSATVWSRRRSTKMLIVGRQSRHGGCTWPR